MDRVTLFEDKVRKDGDEFQDWMLRKDEHYKLIAVERQQYQRIRNLCRIGVQKGMTMLIMDASHPMLHMRKGVDTNMTRTLKQLSGKLC